MLYLSSSRNHLCMVLCLISNYSVNTWALALYCIWFVKLLSPATTSNDYFSFQAYYLTFCLFNLTYCIPSLFLLSSLALKGKKKLGKEKHRSRSGRPDFQSNITEVNKGKKRPARSSKFDVPNKRSKKEGSQMPSGGRRTKKNQGHLDKSICTGHSSSLCNDNREKNHATLKKNCHTAPSNKVPSSTEVGLSKRIAGCEQQNKIGGRHAQFEGRYITPAAHVEANHGNFVALQHHSVQRSQLSPPLREVANVFLPRPRGSHPDALFNTSMGSRHQNEGMAGPHAPAYFRGLRPNQQMVAFSSANMPHTRYRPHPEAAYVVPHYRYPNGSTGFHRWDSLVAASCIFIVSLVVRLVVSLYLISINAISLHCTFLVQTIWSLMVLVSMCFCRVWWKYITTTDSLHWPLWLQCNTSCMHKMAKKTIPGLRVRKVWGKQGCFRDIISFYLLVEFVAGMLGKGK